MLNYSINHSTVSHGLLPEGNKVTIASIFFHNYCAFMVLCNKCDPEERASKKNEKMKV